MVAVFKWLLPSVVLSLLEPRPNICPKMETKKEEKKSKIKQTSSFWVWVTASVIFRLILIYFPKNLNFSSRPEVATPVTSIRRLAEGYWLKQSSMSPYAGSMYHGSPLLLSLIGPLTVKRIEGQPNHLLCRKIKFYSILSLAVTIFSQQSGFVMHLKVFDSILGTAGSLLFSLADVVSAMLIRATGQTLQMSSCLSLKSLDLVELSKNSEMLSSGDIAALVYLWNPFTIVACVGLSTSPIENLVVILSLYGACTSKKLKALSGTWVLNLILLLGNGPDAPPRKLFLQRRCSKGGKNPSSDSSCQEEELFNQSKLPITFSWKPVIHFLFWASIWSVYVLVLCGISVKQNGGMLEMFKSTYGFILTVEDLSPNIGVLWYFFAEVFEFFRNFFLIVFHMNILVMILPLAIRLNHRPCFLAFVYIAISSMLKSYPSVSSRLSAQIYILAWSGILNIVFHAYADLQFSFFLFWGCVGVSLLSPVMHNLWIWRGTGNANFYYATAMAFACFQIVLVVESVSAILNYDRKLRKLFVTKPVDGKS
ncbi:hypothetical protein WN944_013760 [Citrus x changshan-huyou]|uniref:GPI transamidase subunit PIG-U n=1 Tax=Citrus x changshan-huyou TaxID=2935761 RepID=A0AAP0QKY0_9ROSI